MDGWPGVEFRHLTALGAVHDERSFRGAAERLGYVQSAISQQIAQLELLVGVRLVERARGHAPPVALTEAGLLLLDHGLQILSQLDAAQSDLRSLADGETRRLRLGVVHSVATKLLPAALATLKAQSPALAIEIEEATQDRQLFSRVEAGDLDAAFAELPLVAGPFEAAELLVDPCVLLVPARSARATAGPPATHAELVELPLIRIEQWPMFDLIEAHLRAAGAHPRFALRVDASAAVQALVAAGCGAAIMPRLAVVDADPGVAVLDVGELLPPRRIALFWHAGRRQRGALRRFHEAMRDSCAAYAGPTPVALSPA